jgi:molybdate transport system substrate-binding protein
VVIAIAWAGVDARQPPARVRVAAASDLQFALDEVIRQFAGRHPSVRVEPTYGSSGNFHAQLRQRAPFDLFLSADMSYARDLVARGVGQERDLFAYAVGRLVVWVPNGSALRPERDGLRALLSAKRVAIGNPRHAPYGRAAEAALRNAGVWRALEPRLVLAENIAQAAQFVQSGAADAGLVARSLTAAPSMRAAGRFWEVPADAYPALVQGGLVLPWAASRDSTLQLRDFLIGPGGRAVLSAFGFAPSAD